MSDKLKSASKLPELRLVLFIVFGVAVWLFLVAGIVPPNQGAIAAVPAQDAPQTVQLAGTGQ